jgi:hypothetical protein
MNATPRPWRVVEQKSLVLMENREQIVAHVLLPDGRKVLCPDRATADLIVRAVNSHNATAKALSRLTGIVKARLQNELRRPDVIEQCEAALALANGKDGAK